MGTLPGVGNIYSHNVGLAIKATVQPLSVPATIYVRLTTMLTGGGEVYYDYTYTTSHGIVKR